MKIIKFEFESDSTPTVEMKPDHQEEDLGDDEDNKEDMTTGDHHLHQHHRGKNIQTQLYYGSFSEKMDLMCKIINESSRLISGAKKMCGVTRDNMSPIPKATSPPTLHTVVWRDGVPNDEEMIGYRQDDCGNDVSDNGDDRQEDVGNNNGESNDEEMLGDDHQDDNDNQTEETAGDHSKNSRKKKHNNDKKKKNKRKKN